MAEFVRKFDRGCHFVPLIARDAAEKLRHFMDGRIFIQGVATYALLDSEAAHSFISDTFIKRLIIIPEDMGLDFKVSIPSGDQMITSIIVKNLELRLQKDVVQADLIVLPMPEFDIILSMNWLPLYGASIDFRQRKLMKRGCLAFLVCVTSALVPDSQTLEDVEIVRDFHSVFPEDVSGIQPDR
ncbi:uncharacterized protein LOC142519641 [Primulina tabacum]|uniref:uncharacterized protein LOC142519641 n=1 Tax=Primulina tabacum TaxID=48773 RepID=UPI003F5946BB